MTTGGTLRRLQVSTRYIQPVKYKYSLLQIISNYNPNLHPKNLESESQVTKYNCSLRSNSTKYSRPRLADNFFVNSKIVDQLRPFDSKSLQKNMFLKAYALSSLFCWQVRLGVFVTPLLSLINDLKPGSD